MLPCPAGAEPGRPFSGTDHALALYPVPEVRLLPAYRGAENEFEA